MASRVNVILGTMEFGRNANPAQSEEMVQMFVDAGYNELDTAFMYSDGQSETFLGGMETCKNSALNIQIATKANPWSDKGLKPARVLEQFKISLDRLKASSIDIFYLHAPDHKTPIEDTLQAVQQLYAEGKFKRFGLSNYAAWQVVDIYHRCKAKGWVLPTVYQGMYNAITREVEKELFPALRACNIAFYAYNPLAGGLLTGRYQFSDADHVESQPKSRFFGQGWADVYRGRFWKKENFDAFDRLKDVLKATYGDSVSLTSASLRWMIHHSKLSGQHHDAVILGASKVHHLKENLSACKEGPLAEAVVKAFDEAWESTKGHCPPYFR